MSAYHHTYRLGVMAALLIVAAMAVSAVANEFALVNMSVACVREQPRHSAELGSQVVMGTPVEIVDTDDGWCKVVTPDGYNGYIIEHSLTLLTGKEFDAWRQSPRVIITEMREIVGMDPDSGEPVTDLVAGAILQYSWNDGAIEVTTPDGRHAVIPDSCAVTIEEWAHQDVDKEVILSNARELMGRPYLWGGTSVKAMDCSGLTSICYYMAGIILPRNASQQATTGTAVDKKDLSALRRGDLITFGNPRTGRVTHVAIYDADGRYVHSSGRVKMNSLCKDAAGYLPLNVLHVRRINDDYPRVSEHHWYFLP